MHKLLGRWLPDSSKWKQMEQKQVMLWLMRNSDDPVYPEIRRDMVLPLWKSVFPGKKI